MNGIKVVFVCLMVIIKQNNPKQQRGYQNMKRGSLSTHHFLKAFRIIKAEFHLTSQNHRGQLHAL